MYIEHTINPIIFDNYVYIKNIELISLLMLEANCDKHSQVARNAYLDVATQLANIKGLKT